MKKMRDERAVRGAAEEAAKMYRRAVLAVLIMGAFKVLVWMAGRSSWYPLLAEGLALLLGGGVVMVQRIRLGLWGEMDAPMTEMLHIARAKGFRTMFRVTAAAMILGFIFDNANSLLYYLTALTLAMMNNHLLAECRNNGWLHGLKETPQEGWRAIAFGILGAVCFAAFVLGACWFVEKKPPETGEIVYVAVFAAVICLDSVYATRKEFRDSQRAADEVLRGAERRAEREESDEELMSSAGGDTDEKNA